LGGTWDAPQVARCEGVLPSPGPGRVSDVGTGGVTAGTRTGVGPGAVHACEGWDGAGKLRTIDCSEAFSSSFLHCPSRSGPCTVGLGGVYGNTGMGWRP
jgi:hypothetical protein